MSVAAIFVIYGILLILGGAMGFAKAKSKPSLISGVVTGIISLVIAFVSGSHRGTALTLGILLGIGLGIFFAARFSATKKPMPSLFMSIMSFIVALGSIVLQLVGPHTS